MIEALTFDDVLLKPQYSEIVSRNKVLLTSGKLELKLPIISANMDTVTEEDMAIAMHRAGGAGIIHRYLSPERLDQIIVRCRAAGINPFISIGVTEQSSKELLAVALKRNVTNFCIDVAHGHHRLVGETLTMLRKIEEANKTKFTIIAGNVATKEGVVYLISKGADIIKVGVGPGSHCTTRIVTGHGIPQLTAILECAEEAAKFGSEIIADGGIRNSGDIAKAIAAGASYVMVGKLLAGTDEAPGKKFKDSSGKYMKSYRGMASREARPHRSPEGVSSSVQYHGPVAPILEELKGGLSSALSYTGASDICEFQKKAIFVRITHNSYIEGTPHGTK